MVDYIATKPSQVVTSLFINYFTLQRKTLLDPSVSARNTVLGRAERQGSIFLCPLPTRSDPRWASEPHTHTHTRSLVMHFYSLACWLEEER